MGGRGARRRTSPAPDIPDGATGSAAGGAARPLLHCPSVTVYTLGHSTLSLAEFLGRLDAHGIRVIADVRRFPASRRHPHFTRDALARALADHEVTYDWLESLGGRRPA